MATREHGVSREMRLRLFDQATKRQRLREAAQPPRERTDWRGRHYVMGSRQARRTGRVRFDQTVDVVLEEIEQHPALSILPLDARIALESTRLGDRFPPDPADQLIVATARVHALRLLTADDRIRRSGSVSVI